MLKLGSIVKVTDNSGALEAQIIGVIGAGAMKHIGIARVVKVSIKKAKPDGNIKEHEKHRAVVVRVKKEYKRADGTYIRFDDNAVVILTGGDSDSKKIEKIPVATRIFGPVARELKAYGFDKITQLAPEVL